MEISSSKTFIIELSLKELREILNAVETYNEDSDFLDKFFKLMTEEIDK